MLVKEYKYGPNPSSVAGEHWGFSVTKRTFDGYKSIISPLPQLQQVTNDGRCLTSLSGGLNELTAWLTFWMS